MAADILRQQWNSSSDFARQSLRENLKCEIMRLQKLVKDLESRMSIVRDCKSTVQVAIEDGFVIVSDSPGLQECLSLQAACAQELVKVNDLDDSTPLSTVITTLNEIQAEQSLLYQWQQEGLHWKMPLLKEMTA